MLKILALDPSGTGTTGVCLVDKSVNFKEFKGKVWQDHLNFLNLLVAKKKPNLILYENTNYINSRGKDMTSLLKLIGSIEGLPVKRIETILVHQVKDLKSKLFKGTKQIPNLTYQPGKGWFYQAKKLSLHELDAFLVYQLWKEKGGSHG